MGKAASGTETTGEKKKKTKIEGTKAGSPGTLESVGGQVAGERARACVQVAGERAVGGVGVERQSAVLAVKIPVHCKSPVTSGLSLNPSLSLVIVMGP